MRKNVTRERRKEQFPAEALTLGMCVRARAVRRNAEEAECKIWILSHLFEHVKGLIRVPTHR